MKRQIEMWSEVLEANVTALFETHDVPQVNCSRCGKPLKQFYVVIDDAGIERMYLGTCCINKL